MTNQPNQSKPNLRPLDFQPVYHQGEQMWLLRDPLNLTNHQIVMPQPLALLATFIDGTRTPQQIHQDFCRRLGAPVGFDIITDTLAQLDQACLLDNDRAATARAAKLATYRAAPNRPATLADICYAADPAELTTELIAYGSDDDLTGWQPWAGRGIISPHIDYQRGGPVYAQTWTRATTAVAQADIVLIFGTDHNGGPGTFTLTTQSYATPYGTLPTDPDIVNHVANAIGPDFAFAEELHHQQEHAVELSAVWLHHIRHQAGLPTCPMVPILCGSFYQYIASGTHPRDDQRLNTALDALHQATAGKRVLAVASVDFAHVGPAFGDSFPMDQPRRQQLRQTDNRLLHAITHGDADRFYQEIATIRDKNRVCGFSSIYLLLRFLGPTKGTTIAYQHCPADNEDTSLVSISGLLLE
ncbi:MAG TPA: AmmeMemoRadiSam system protein B [Anaerolineae bacterium]|nr:AmmeMemoRadiSam system protein B [Anaerolineae bacterium]